MSPIDDLTSDVITVLHHKTKALAAYDKYLRDAEADDDDELRALFGTMRDQDEQLVLQLKEILAHRLAEDLGYEDDDLDDDDDFDDVAEGSEVEEEEEEEDPANVGADAVDPVHSASNGGPRARRGDSTQRQR